MRFKATIVTIALLVTSANATFEVGASVTLADAEAHGLLRGVVKENEKLRSNTTEPNGRSLFGGEDVARGEPWYHDAFTKESCPNAGFATATCDDIAWHADYVDSYAYNPLWWFDLTGGGGISRFKASRSIFPDLKKVHFDDLDSSGQVITAFNRYFNGCLVGLDWAAQVYADPSLAPGVDPIGAAHNLLGVSLHAIQDFYSHSNWIDDPSRRDIIFPDIPVCDLSSTFLYTGYYENDSGIKPHGKFSVICSLTGDNVIGDALSGAMDLYCSFINPFQNDEICMEYNDCDNPASVSGGEVLGIPIPDNLLYINPPGINLDNTWLAEIGVQVRQIDLTGAEAFDIAKKLAIKASTHFLQAVGKTVADDMGHADFWNKVKSTVSSEPKENQYEEFNHFPFQFITAGPYPDFEINDNGYYLRVGLKTSGDTLSGTDADIKLIAENKVFDLDYMRGSNILIAYNDFEAGDDAVYAVGPFESLPSQIVLKNDAPDVGDILVQLGNDIINFFKAVAEAIKDFFTNDMDYVGTEGFLLEPSWLRSIDVGSSKGGHVYINGGSEGKYRVYFEVTKVSENNANAEATYNVKLTQLYCVEESDIDGFTTKDEPILMAVLASYPGERQSFMKKYKDVDSGDSRYPNHSFTDVTLPNHGAMVLEFQIWESDDESSSDRQNAMNELLGAKDTECEDNFLVLIGEAIAADWKLDSIRVYAFHRGSALQGGQVLFGNTNHWIDGGESRTYSLQASGIKSLPGLNYLPTAACQSVYKKTDAQCQAVAQAFEFDGGSTAYECQTLSFSVLPSGPFLEGTTEVTLTVTDPAGNTDTCNTTITVECPPTIIGFTLVDGSNSEELGELKDGQVIENGYRLNIIAHVKGDNVESVVFGFDGDDSFHTENEAPYAFDGNIGSNYHSYTFKPGTHNVTATPYTKNKGRSDPGIPMGVTFTVEEFDSGSSNSSITGFTLVDGSNSEELGELKDGQVIENGYRLNIIAHVKGDDVESVVFGFDGDDSFHTENEAPYAFDGNIGSNYHSYTFKPGTHEIMATPYSRNNGGGNPGTSMSVSFTVKT